MINTLLAKILTPFFILGSIFTGTPNIEPQLGATLPGATAVFETSLASPISSSATTMTLSANSIRGGGSISGYNCFTVDEGSAQAETICGTVSGTTVSSLSRGISQATGTSTVVALQFAHRRGANVKITDFPIIQILKAQNNGEDTFPNKLTYDSDVGTSSLTFTSSYDIVNRGYVDALSFGAVPAASETASGFVELGSAIEIASSTSLGSTGARLVIPTSQATSTYNPSGSLQVVVTGNNNKIDNNFIATSTLGITASSSSITSGIRLLDIGKNIQVITTTGTSTFTVPSGVNKVRVRLVAGGGTGGNGSNGSPKGGGGGGGGGGYSEEFVDVSATSTIQAYVGTAGLWTTFGTNGFYLSATPGSSGATAGGTSDVEGGSGGCGTGGDINSCGTGGGNGAGAGGGSMFGGGGKGTTKANSANGEAGQNYGGGGAGGYGSGTGGAGAQGVIIITW